MADAATSQIPPVPPLPTEDTPGLDGWTTLPPDPRDAHERALQQELEAIGFGSSEPSAHDNSCMLSRGLARRGIRHIIQYDDPNGAVTIRIGRGDVNQLAVIVSDFDEKAWVRQGMRQLP